MIIQESDETQEHPRSGVDLEPNLVTTKKTNLELETNLVTTKNKSLVTTKQKSSVTTKNTNQMTTKNKSEQKLFTKLEELKAIQERDEQGENAFVGQVQETKSSHHSQIKETKGSHHGQVEETKSSPHKEQAKQKHLINQDSVQTNPVKTANGGHQSGITFEKVTVKTVTTSSLPKKKNTVKTKGEECADCILGLWVKRQCAM